MSSHEAEGTKYYFNTRTREVERGSQSSWHHLMGPYDTAEEAQNALTIAQERNEEWEEEDKEWKDDD